MNCRAGKKVLNLKIENSTNNRREPGGNKSRVGKSMELSFFQPKNCTNVSQGEKNCNARMAAEGIPFPSASSHALSSHSLIGLACQLCMHRQFALKTKSTLTHSFSLGGNEN